MECGIACLKMIAAHYHKNLSNQTMRQYTNFERTGTSMSGLSSAATKLGLKVDAYSVSISQIRALSDEFPCIVHWNNYHFIVLYGLYKNRFLIADPAKGLLKVGEEEFAEYALNTDEDGIPRASTLFFEPTPKFQMLQNDELITTREQLNFFLGSIRRYRRYFIIIVLVMALSLSLQFTIPFFTKSIVDLGISTGDLKFVALLAIGQTFIILSRTFFDMLRNWVSLHLSVRFNYGMISSFLGKLFRLPLVFFEYRKIGDLMQRIGDHYRIESFLTNVTVSSVFSVLSIIVYSIVLCYYNFYFLLIFIFGSMVYLGWIFFFLKSRQNLDWKRFEVSSKNQSILIQMFAGIHDLRINNAENFHFSKWEKNQQEMIKNSFTTIRLNQTQQTGARLISEIMQIMVTVLSASLVISNRISFGGMLSIQFILGQLTAPMEQLINAVINGQDAKISLDRLMDLWNVKEESELMTSNSAIFPILETGLIEFRDVSYKYSGQETQFALHDVNQKIALGKVTAIVGFSGSGKTTLLKLLLGYYHNYEGAILVDGTELRDLDLKLFRDKCGVVLQESYIFNDTIANNITLGLEYDKQKMDTAMKVSCIYDYIDSLPLKSGTLIGNEGKGLSQGQKQRILIARAVYKSPSYLFLDETTNSLDAQNEAEILQNLREFAKGRTVVMVAHRLSTVKDADLIVVVDKGVICEEGTHEELLAKKNVYYNLVKAQIVEFTSQVT